MVAALASSREPAVASQCCPRREENPSLSQLLVQGGDDRLMVDPATGMNGYGCTPMPRPEAIAFSSSTASSISEPAYRRAGTARQNFEKAASPGNASEAFALRVDEVRRTLKALLGLQSCGAEVVFSASGTDAQLHAHFIARMVLGTPLTTIVVGSDQTGSGTVHTGRGRHFSRITALGHAVTKGNAIGTDDLSSIDVPLIGADGQVRPAKDIDAEVMAAVRRETEAGRKVLLQTMESSKLGWRGPSDACVQAILERWPDCVQLLVDACQLRIGRARLKTLLGFGAMVLITGSKFFMGPGFSGAALIPQPLADRLKDIRRFPSGLGLYMAQADVPLQWRGFREGLPADINAGAWLRWEAALEEMTAYYALPKGFAGSHFARLGKVLTDAIAAAPSLELLSQTGGCPPERPDDELPSPTLFAFHVKGRDGYLQHEELVGLYRTLNTDVEWALPVSANMEERRLAAQPCHIGQPVRLGGGRSVLRMAWGARAASQAWSADAGTMERNIRTIAGTCSTVVEKIELLLRYGLAGQ